MSPELMLRPSLSDDRAGAIDLVSAARVAGAYAPAFVERIIHVRYTPADVKCRRSLCSGLR